MNNDYRKIAALVTIAPVLRKEGAVGRGAIRILKGLWGAGSGLGRAAAAGGGGAARAGGVQLGRGLRQARVGWAEMAGVLGTPAARFAYKHPLATAVPAAYVAKKIID